MRSRRLKSALLIVVLLVMINLPLVHSVWTSWQVERNGVDVTATRVKSFGGTSGRRGVC